MKKLIKISALCLFTSSILGNAVYAADNLNPQSPEFSSPGENPALSPDGNTLLVGKNRPDMNNDNNYLVDMYDVKTGTLLKEIPSNNASDRYIYSPGGKYLVSPGTYMNVLDGKSGDQLFTLPYPWSRFAFQRTNEDIAAFAYSSSPATFTEGDTLVIFDMEKREELFRKTYSDAQMMRVALHPTEPVVAVSHGLDIEIINYQTGQVLKTITNPFQLAQNRSYSAIQDIKYSPDGRTLSIISGETVAVPYKQYDTVNNYQESEPVNVYVNEPAKNYDILPISIQYNPDGTMYLFSHGKIKAFDAKSGSFKWELDKDINDPVFTSDLGEIAYIRNDYTDRSLYPTYVTVQKFPLSDNTGERIEFGESYLQLREGNSTYYGLYYYDRNNQKTLLDPSQVTLEPFDSDIVGIDSTNRIIAKKPGSTIIKASYNGLAAYISVEVDSLSESKIIVGPLYDSTIEIKGKAIPNVALDAAYGNRYYEVNTDNEGNFVLDLDKPLAAGTNMAFSCSIPNAGKADFLFEHVIRDTVAPNPPTISSVNTQTDVMQGITEPNATITVVSSNPIVAGIHAMSYLSLESTSITTVKAGKDGKFQLTLPFGGLAGKKLSTTSTDLAGNQSKVTVTSIPAPTGWVKQNSQWYYFNKNGTMATGWLAWNNHWYYLSNSGAMATGWLKSGSNWYFLSGSGEMMTGWLKSGSNLYYLSNSGAMATGWLKSGNDSYYLDPSSGAMKTGWFKIGGKWYYFYTSGKMAHDTKIGSYRLGHSGALI